MKSVVKSMKRKRLMRLKVYKEGFKRTNSPKGWSAVASVRDRLLEGFA